MPKGQRKDYSKEFKLSAVHLMKSKLFKPKEVFEMLGGIDRQTVYRWIKEYDEKGESAFDTKKAVPLPHLREAVVRKNAVPLFLAKTANPLSLRDISLSKGILV